jgi:D-arabinose 1-dehydrogenase-like Zn-dependent alcohol dehydrogenase
MCYIIPEALPSEYAAPLLCAGITTFSPLRRFAIGTGSRVGVVGLGGLGHLAVKFAAALGAEVTVFSSSPEKHADAKAFGASESHSSIDPKLGNKKLELDLILVTSTANYDWSNYIANLKARGTLCFVSLPTDAVRVQVSQLVMRERSITGSVIGGSERMREMLRFASENKIYPQIELYPVSQVNHALNKLRNNEIRYRAVLNQFSAEELQKIPQ